MISSSIALGRRVHSITVVEQCGIRDDNRGKYNSIGIRDSGTVWFIQ